MTVIQPDGQPLTLDDLEALWELFSSLDGHTREAGDIKTWMTIAGAARWTRAQVAAAALTVATEWTGYRIMPGHLTLQIKADREQVRKAWARECPDPPRSLRDDPRGEIAWRRRAAESFAERALLALATGGLVEDVPLVLDQESEPVAALPPGEMARRIEQAATETGRLKAVPDDAVVDGSVPRPVGRRVQLDPETRRQVRADLDARRAGTDDEAVSA